MAEAGTSSSALEQARNLERGLLRVRWFGILLGLWWARELGRGAFLAPRFPVSGFYGGVLEQRYSFLISGVAFRVGILAIIAIVGGFMARSLAREAENSAQQAAKFEDLARREM